MKTFEDLGWVHGMYRGSGYYYGYKGELSANNISFLTRDRVVRIEENGDQKNGVIIEPIGVMPIIDLLTLNPSIRIMGASMIDLELWEIIKAELEELGWL